MKYFQIIILMSMCYNFIKAQADWKPVLTQPYYEVNDLAILQDNRYYLSLQKSHEIFESLDSGTSWKVVWPINVKFNNFASKKLYIVKDDLYVGIIPRVEVSSIYSLSKSGEFTLEKTGNYLDPLGTKCDREGNLFSVEGDQIFPINSDLKIERNNRVLAAYYGIQSFFYTSENNYFITIASLNLPDTVRIIKFNSKTGEYNLHSKFYGDIVQQDILVSEKGSVLYRKDGNHIFTASYTDPLNFKEVYIDSGRIISEVYYLSLTNSGEFFLVTNAGIYMCDGIHMFDWHRCEQMSTELPIQDQNDVDNYYCFKDSLSALISYGTICGASRVYSFSPKYYKWKEVILDIRLENIIDLKADKAGKLYGIRPCDGWLKNRFLISEDQSKTWKYLNVQGFDVNGLAINKDGNAVSIALNKEVFVHNPMTNVWDNIITSGLINAKVKLYHCYSIGEDLILEGLDESYRPAKPSFYYSSDGGKTWFQTILPLNNIDQFNPSFKTLVDKEGNWLIYNSGLNNTSDHLPMMLSLDKGKTWKLDPRFTEFTEINEAIMLNDGRFIVSAIGNPARYKNTVILFIVNVDGKIEILEPFSEKARFSLKLISNNAFIMHKFLLDGSEYPLTIINYNGATFNTSYSSTGLGHSDQDSWLIKSAVLGKNNKIFLSLAMDGIYTNSKELFNSVQSISSNSTVTILSNLTSDYLLLSLEDEKSDAFEKYSIVNALGSILSVGNLSRDLNFIPITQLNSGVYYLLLYGISTNQCSLKFVKY